MSHEDSSLTVSRGPRGAWFRALDAVGLWTRASLSALGVGRAPPREPGVSYGRVASRPKSQDHLRQMSESAGVFAAVQRRSRTLADAPIVVMRDGAKVDPKAEPWAQELLDLLTYPDPLELASRGDPTGLAPLETGESLIAQLVADLLLTGQAWVIPTAADSRRIVGLSRAHPGGMQIVDGGAHVERRVDGLREIYPRRGVFCLRLVSWEQSGQGELGTGAGAVLENVVSAEKSALAKTAAVIDQGGADVIVTSATPTGVSFLSNPANRDRVKNDVQNALAMRDGSRVIVLSGDIKAEPAGFTPAEMQAPELMDAARAAEMLALGDVTSAIGADGANYSVAAAKYRLQAELDENLASVFEAFLLRPLAQHYARALGKGAQDARRVTARLDLSGHPGYAYARTEAIDRMVKLVDLGWTPEQAAEIEGQPFPKPRGTPAPKQAAAAPPKVEAVKGDGPQRADRERADAPEGD